MAPYCLQAQDAASPPVPERSSAVISARGALARAGTTNQLLSGWSGERAAGGRCSGAAAEIIETLQHLRSPDEPHREMEKTVRAAPSPPLLYTKDRHLHPLTPQGVDVEREVGPARPSGEDGGRAPAGVPIQKTSIAVRDEPFLLSSLKIKREEPSIGIKTASTVLWVIDFDPRRFSSGGGARERNESRGRPKSRTELRAPDCRAR